MKMASDWSTLPKAGKCTYFMHRLLQLQTWHSPDKHTFNEIDHCLIDGRHFSDVIDVMAWRGAIIDSDHMLVSNTKPQQLKRFAVDRLKDRDVASRYYDELESGLQGVQARPLSLDEKCKKLKEPIQREATNTISHTRKQVNKEGFDEECAKVNEEKMPPENLPSKPTPEEPRMLTN
jgi:hypothetical protein